ncbi:hypothetical protein A2U01_0044358, partial [Trifolium medium]|nr:hypothetical protein [Trifolium medium]
MPIIPAAAASSLLPSAS